MTHRWILNGNDKWHAWPVKGRSTFCGTINLEDLRQRPAKAVAEAPDHAGKVCVSCARKTNYVRVGSVDGADPTASAWAGAIRRYLKHKHMRAGIEAVDELARRMAEVGPPEDLSASRTFALIQPLLLHPLREQRQDAVGRVRTVSSLPFLKASLALLPSDRGAVKVLADVMNTWQQITRRDPYTEKFRPDRVVGVMLQVPDPAQYINRLAGRLPTLAAIFHPSTLERAKRDAALRGMFAGNTAQWVAQSGQLHILED